MLRELISNKIKYARKLANITQQEMADKLGVAKNTVSRWESNSNPVGIDDLERIAEILNINNYSWFFQADKDNYNVCGIISNGNATMDLGLSNSQIINNQNTGEAIDKTTSKTVDDGGMFLNELTKAVKELTTTLSPLKELPARLENIENYLAGLEKKMEQTNKTIHQTNEFIDQTTENMEQVADELEQALYYAEKDLAIQTGRESYQTVDSVNINGIGK